jgi:hypothetical protein
MRSSRTWLFVLAMGLVPPLAGHALAAPPAPTLPTCQGELSGTRVYGGNVAFVGAKSWQPRGGEFSFVIETPNAIPDDALVTVCFGWKRAGGTPEATDFTVESHPTRIVQFDASRKSVTIAATVPALTSPLPRWADHANGSVAGVYEGLWTVPVADVRVLVYKPTGEPVVDTLTTVGITSTAWAFACAIAAVALGLGLLYGCARIRQPQLARVNPLLRIIATERNYASLSQAQIILWTLVVGASAVYVMALSGDLIDITGGTLVLLGISGGATVASKWKSAIDDQARSGAPLPAVGAGGAAIGPPAAVVPAAPAVAQPGSAAGPGQPAAIPAAPAVAPATGPAGPPAAVPPKSRPQWTDLLVSLDQVNGTFVATIDVTRVQMLFFTLITAAFVVLKVITSYEIPPIPDGFMTLMGVSNGVYLGSKFAK